MDCLQGNVSPHGGETPGVAQSTSTVCPGAVSTDIRRRVGTVMFMHVYPVYHFSPYFRDIPVSFVNSELPAALRERFVVGSSCLSDRKSVVLNFSA